MLVNNYNFGVYNPPSGLETVINSYQASTVLALKSNNLQAKKEKGIQQSFGIPLFKLVDIDINLINYLITFILYLLLD